MIPNDPFFSPIEVFSSYLSFFQNLNVIDCPVDSCKLLELGCGLPSTQPEVTISTVHPFPISGATTNIYGYSHEFCLKCTVTKGEGPHVFTQDQIKIQGDFSCIITMQKIMPPN